MNKSNEFFKKWSVDIDNVNRSIFDCMEAFAKDETALIESSWRLQKQRGDDFEVEIKELRGLLDKVKETLPEWDKIYPGLAEKIINI